MLTKEQNATIKRALEGWHSLLYECSHLDEEMAEKALVIESSKNKPRKSVLIRLHQHYCALRTSRERAALLKEVA